MIRRRRSQQVLQRLLILLVLVICGVGLVWIFHSHTQKKEGQHSLQDAVQQVLKSKSGTFGIYIKNLKTGESYGFNSGKYFATGSLYKLWVMSTVVQEIEKGKIQKDEILSDDVDHLNQEFHIASEDADLTDGTITLSVNDALTQMVTISHNYAALLLTQKISEEAISKFLTDNKLSYSHLGGTNGVPVSTASDVSLFLEKLYKGQLGNPSSTSYMIDLLKSQQFKEKLPKYLPSNTVIAHKTGELDSFSHDAGIVYAPNGPYIIVVLSKSTNSYDANDTIGKISKAVYDYFLKGGEEKNEK